MKIVSVLTTDSSGGAEFAAVELLDALAERGHETILLTNAPSLERGTRVSIREIDLGPKLSRATYRAIASRFPRLVGRLRSALRQEQPFDVLLVHFKKEQLLTLALPRHLLQQCVWMEWGPLPDEFRRGLPNRLYRQAARRANLVLAISVGTKASLVDAGIPADKVVVLHNAVRTEEIRFDAAGRSRMRAHLRIPSEAFVVGCISRFHPKKRNDVVVEAVMLLRDDVHIVLAGAGETEESLRTLAAPLGERAHFLPTPTSNVTDVYSALDVSVFCPSPTEGAPRAVILAMLAERPVVSTGAEGVVDLIGDGGGRIISPENDPAALAEALRAYAGDRELAKSEGRKGRRLAETRHGSRLVAEEFQELLARHRPDGSA